MPKRNLGDKNAKELVVHKTKRFAKIEDQIAILKSYRPRYRFLKLSEGGLEDNFSKLLGMK